MKGLGYVRYIWSSRSTFPKTLSRLFSGLSPRCILTSFITSQVQCPHGSNNESQLWIIPQCAEAAARPVSRPRSIQRVHPHIFKAHAVLYGSNGKAQDQHAEPRLSPIVKEAPAMGACPCLANHRGTM